MAKSWRVALMGWLRVPPEPQPPAGAPGSARVFRSGRNALRLSLAGWGIKQVFAVVGLVFWLLLLGHLRAVRGEASGAAAPAAVPSWLQPIQQVPPVVFLHHMAVKTPEAVVWWFTLAEILSLITFLIQLPLTYALRRLDYEQRWFIVTDRSLRLRSGVWRLREVTMSFANLQHISVTQNPVQRLLGLADVRVQSAGGGSILPSEDIRGREPAHLGFFRAVDNADEIRDLILERLRQFKQSGLGDPDEPESFLAHPTAEETDRSAIHAAKELLLEARALHRCVKSK